MLAWNVKQFGTDDFTVAYEVDQQVKEGEQTQAVTENYTVTPRTFPNSDIARRRLYTTISRATRHLTLLSNGDLTELLG